MENYVCMASPQGRRISKKVIMSKFCSTSLLIMRILLLYFATALLKEYYLFYQVTFRISNQ